MATKKRPKTKQPPEERLVQLLQQTPEAITLTRTPEDEARWNRIRTALQQLRDGHASTDPTIAADIKAMQKRCSEARSAAVRVSAHDLDLAMTLGDVARDLRKLRAAMAKQKPSSRGRA